MGEDGSLATTARHETREAEHEQQRTAGLWDDVNGADGAVDDELADVPTISAAGDVGQIKAEIVIAIAEKKAAVRGG